MSKILEKNLELNNVVKMCEMVVNKDISRIEFETFVENNLKVISYIPLVEKMAILYIINYHPKFNENTFDSVVMQINMEILKLFKILLAYTNINTDDYNEKIFSENNYDLIYESGLADYILNKCKNDYEKLTSMLSETINFNNVINLNDLLNSIDNNNVEEGINALKYFNDEMSKEDKDRIVEILKEKDPMLNMLKEQIERTALEEVKSKFKEV